MIIIAVGIISIPYVLNHEANLSALVNRAFTERVTPDIIKASYATRPIRILIVPGHDNQYSGTAANGLREADATLATAKYLYSFLSLNPSFTTFVTRNFTTGEYNPDFKNYFTTESDSIEKYMESQKNLMDNFIESGSVEGKVTNNFVTAKTEVKNRLYGINKWANENDIDIVLHIHFNDYPGRRSDSISKYSGFSVYVPEDQLPNSRVSVDVANSVASELQKMIAKSDMPLEKDNVIQTQELIAIGSNATRVGASMLVEYGYIYEPQIADTKTRNLVFQEMAYRTYRGIVGYFDSKVANVLPQTSLLPYRFRDTIQRTSTPNTDVIRMQAALLNLGFYPPLGTTLQNCPLTGIYGNCTVKAVREFQNKYADDILRDECLLYGSGIAKQKTLEKLNALLKI